MSRTARKKKAPEKSDAGEVRFCCERDLMRVGPEGTWA